MSVDDGRNVYEEPLEQLGGGVSRKRLRRFDGHLLGATVWELAPGSDGIDYHFHHGTEELLIVLRGAPLMRSFDGEWSLAEGEVLHFVPGVSGGHKISNPSAEPVRYVVIGSHVSPDIVEYPYAGSFLALSKLHNQYGEPFRVHEPLKGPES